MVVEKMARLKNYSFISAADTILPRSLYLKVTRRPKKKSNTITRSCCV